MINYPKIILKPGKEAPLQRFHPWIFSGAIQKTEGNPGEGDVVEVYSSRKEYLATGHFLRGNISVKVFSFQQVQVDLPFWKIKLQSAYDLRKQLGLTDNPSNNAYRLVFSEGDHLPGLILDFYNGSAVIQCQSPGMNNHKPDFVAALQELYGDKLKEVYDKSIDANFSIQYPASGIQHPVIITETGHKFLVDIEKGQKTGFFLDQRTNRMLAQYYARNRKVLNAFCYSGAFSVYALLGGANMVHSVDSSKQAVEWTKENLTLNEIPQHSHEEFVDDIKNFLPVTKEMYDMIILDPPAFAKHHNVSHNALQAYIHINAEAMKKLNQGGILFTFSCSQSVSREMFRSAIQSAAINTGKDVKILHHLSQGPDHPVSIFHPEGEYLKGLVLGV
jgi:23S rRNA (cytosine1962-C5)-methyltransferase